MTRIYGIDFTSVPSLQKPITCAIGELRGQFLTLDRIDAITSLIEFEQRMHAPGPWVGGFDFPFSQPYELINWLHMQHNWPLDWNGFIDQISLHTLAEFGELLAKFRDSRGDQPKNAKRAVDRQARSISSMLMAYVPVGKMFFRGVPALKRAGVSILPCQPTASQKIALEVYPALVARTIIGHQSYKNDRTTAQRQPIREQILNSLCDPHGPSAERYGITIVCAQPARDACLHDSSGDTLDAVMAALQAAWATTQPDYGIPAGHELEGWIADPATQAQPA